MSVFANSQKQMNAIIRVQLDHASDKHLELPHQRDYRQHPLVDSQCELVGGMLNGQSSEGDKPKRAYLNTYALFRRASEFASTDFNVRVEQEAELVDIDYKLLQCIARLFGGKAFARTFGQVTIIQVILPIERD